MRTNNKTNEIFVEPLNEALGKKIVKINAQDNLKFWEIELEDGSKLGFDTDVGRHTDKGKIYVGLFGAPAVPLSTMQAQNAQTETHATKTLKPADAEAQAGGVSSPVFCSAGSVCRSCGDLNHLPTGNTVGVPEGMLCLKCFDEVATQSHKEQLKQRLLNIHTMARNLGPNEFLKEILSNPSTGHEV